jgi:type VI secretion system protein ImpJ
MSDKSAVVWSQGLFLKPEHFQQQDRYAQYQRNGYLSGRLPYSWGVTCLEFQDPSINKGKLVLNRVSGVMPDGLVFNSEVENCLPESMTIPAFTQDMIVYLAINRSRGDTVEISREAPYTRRFKVGTSSARDNAFGLGSETVAPQDTVDVAIPNLMLITSNDSTSDLDTLAIARIRDIDSEGNVLLDGQFVPVCMSIQCSEYLSQFTANTLALLETLDTRLANFVGPVQEGEFANTLHGAFSLLLAVRRYRQKFRHIMSLTTFHPADLYAVAAEALAELGCFCGLPFPENDIKGYDHNDPTPGFNLLCVALGNLVTMLSNNVDKFTGQPVATESLQPDDSPPDPVPPPVKKTPKVPPW